MGGMLGKALAGLGKGMVEVGETTYRSQVEEMRQMRLAQYQAGLEEHRAQRDRAWGVEDRDLKYQKEEEQFDRNRAWDREKMGIQHGYQLSEIGARKNASIEEHKAKGEYDKGQPGKWENIQDADGKLWLKNEKTGEIKPANVSDAPTEYKVPSDQAFDGQDAENLTNEFGKGGLINKGKTRQLEGPTKEGDQKTRVNAGGVPMTVSELNEQYKAVVATYGDRMKQPPTFPEWLQQTYGLTLDSTGQARPASNADRAKQQQPGGGRLRIGDVVDGYRYKGGSEKDPSNWESVR